MNEAQVKFFEGLKQLEQSTGYTVIGCSYSTVYIVPLNNPLPYSKESVSLVCSSKEGLIHGTE